MNSSLSFNEVSNYIVHDFWETIGDDRVSFYPLLKGGPWHVLGITFCYLVFVLYLGQKWMVNRPPYQLRLTMLIHNLLLIIANLFIFIMMLTGSSWYNVAIKCSPLDPSSVHFTDRVLLNCIILYFYTKYLDMFDTVFLVLRKKSSQITFLHVFHHASMPFYCYLTIKFTFFSTHTLIVLINSLVHLIMYTYYALSALGSKMKPYLWWKRYLTQLQLAQFTIFLLYFLFKYTDPSCTVAIPRFSMVLFEMIGAVIFIFLFSTFYYKRYYLMCMPIKLTQQQQQQLTQSNDNNNLDHSKLN